MNLRMAQQFRQKAAQLPTCVSTVLEGGCASGTVTLAAAIHLPFVVADGNVPSPSLNGQTYVPHTLLPVPFFGKCVNSRRFVPATRRPFAHRRMAASQRLRSIGHPVHISALKPNHTEGWEQCEQNKSQLLWRSASAWPHVVTRKQNRRFMAAGRVSWGPLSLTETQSQARLSVPQPTCCIAKRKTPVTDGTPVTNIQTPAGLTVYARHAVLGSWTQGSVLRSQHLKTKDIACSTRS